MQQQLWYFYTQKTPYSPKVFHATWHGKRPQQSKIWKELQKQLGSIKTPSDFDSIGYTIRMEDVDKF